MEGKAKKRGSLQISRSLMRILSRALLHLKNENCRRKVIFHPFFLDEKEFSVYTTLLVSVLKHEKYAFVAQLAERVLGKNEVSGSIPDKGSRWPFANGLRRNFLKFRNIIVPE